MRLVIALGFVLAILTPLDAAEAMLTDGKRVPGTPSLDSDGRLRFTPRGKTEPLPADAVRVVRFDGTAPPLRLTGIRCVHFGAGERLTGQWVGFKPGAIRLRTAWSDEVSIPVLPGALVTPLPGQRIAFEDDFRAGLRGWETMGKPAGDGEIVLAEIGQSLAFRPKQPPTSGEMAVNCEPRGGPSGARWLVELTFQAEKETRLRIDVAGEHYVVEAQGMEGTARRVAIPAGWRRLRVRFGDKSISVLADDEVLWHNLEHGPGGSLRHVRLACVEGKGQIQGRVAFGEFAMFATATERPIQRDRDKVILANGDELFAEEPPRGDWRAVEIVGRFGKRSLPWSELSGVYYDSSRFSPYAPNQKRVRLVLRTSWGGEPDTLEGDLKRLDDRRLTLKHESLGELMIELAHVKEVRLP
jgi:hypothetical protein